MKRMFLDKNLDQIEDVYKNIVETVQGDARSQVLNEDVSSLLACVNKISNMIKNIRKEQSRISNYKVKNKSYKQIKDQIYGKFDKISKDLNVVKNLLEDIYDNEDVKEEKND